MPEWEQMVRERLAVAKPGAEIEREVAEELAHHLEDVCEAGRQRGLSGKDSVNRAWAEVKNWPRLARKINEARGGNEMLKQRIQAMWLPGLAATIATLVIPMGVGLVKVIPMRVSLVADRVYTAPKAAMFVYGAWLVIMAVIGALAAYWSRRAGGSMIARLTAALLPAGVLLVVIVIVLVASLITLNQLPASMTLAEMARSMVRAVLLPAAALLAGALPFLGRNSVENELRAGAA